MIRALLFSLLLTIQFAYASEEKRFTSKKECYDYCNAEFDRMMKDAGFDHLSIEEDVGSYVAQIRFKHDKCIKNCQLLFN